MKKQARPDTGKVLSTLKDFQRETVDYVFRRMYLDEDYARRFLIADEVGLGKTLVAKGVIAKVIDHHWDKIDRIDVVHICSNGDIARQNINRLNVTESDEYELASRITLLPIQFSKVRSNSVNLVSFTPGTSFDQASNLGMKLERMLLYWLLKNAWDVRGKGALNVLQGNVQSYERFRSAVSDFRHEYEIDKGMMDEYARVLNSQETKPLKKKFEELTETFRNPRGKIPYDQRQERNEVIGSLRALLARTCLKHLEPDLIILDEFQRFKYLLDETSEAGQLAHELFGYSDEHTEARVIMLSATPYKMYTISGTEDLEDHYEDFLNTYKFLAEGDKGKVASFAQDLARYRDRLLTFLPGDISDVVQTKKCIEDTLRKVMVRTERLAVTATRNGMLIEKEPRDFTVEVRDVQAYVAVEKIVRSLEEYNVLEYWKSAPYLLNFMDDYSLKESFVGAIEERASRNRLVKLLTENTSLALSPEEIKQYRKIDPQNALVRSMMKEIEFGSMWKLLWMPPSLPYYKLGEPFQSAYQAGLTKRLVFSAWKLVPKVIATLVSYEVERLISCSFEDSPANTQDAREKKGQLLRFARSSGRLTGMPVMGLIYPSTVLACECDPLKSIQQIRTDGLPNSVEDLMTWATDRIKPLLAKLARGSRPTGQVDERWYWAAPILIDIIENSRTDARAWLFRDDLASLWSGGLDEVDLESAWHEHVVEFKDLVNRFDREPHVLGRMPDDLANVLAKIAVAAPGVCALRALSRVSEASLAMKQIEVKDAAASVAWSFLTLFNSSEATDLIRGMNRKEPYWERILDYSTVGCLQAVLDEYFHMLVESEGLLGKHFALVANGISQAACSAVTLRTARLSVDDISNIQGSTLEKIANFGRARFALRFDNEESDVTTEQTRADQVRDAFNSPFWPFVLATTSVGQEGLDFHPYCHAVVHWNLPSNPVDLEQREGRVHRYKGHAVRKNVATTFGSTALRTECPDIWEFLFDLAKNGRPVNSSDLVPFWLYPIENGASIERYAPAYPLSREKVKILDLKRSLAMYRMVFGQSRQQDLVDLLLKRMTMTQCSELVDQLRMNLSPSGV